MIETLRLIIRPIERAEADLVAEKVTEKVSFWTS
jgi:hypothetical protein